MWEGPATMGGATPGEVALGCIRKVTKPSGQRSPHRPCSTSCLRVPSLTPSVMEGDLKVVRWNTSFLTQAAFGGGVYPSNRNQTKIVWFQERPFWTTSLFSGLTRIPQRGWISLVLLVGFWVVSVSYCGGCALVIHMQAVCEWVLILRGVYKRVDVCVIGSSGFVLLSSSGTDFYSDSLRWDSHSHGWGSNGSPCY